jgi:threonyl-tRNA synthetase
VQVKVLPVSDKHVDYAKDVSEQIRKEGIRVELSEGDSLGKRIRAAKVDKVPYFLVIGDQEVEAGTATLESREAKVGAFPVAEIISKLKEQIRNRS